MAHLQNTIISGSLTVLGQINLPEGATIGTKKIATEDAVQEQLNNYEVKYNKLNDEITALSNSSIQIFSGSVDPSTLEFTSLNSGDIYLKLG